MKKLTPGLCILCLLFFVLPIVAQDEPKGKDFKKAKDLFNKGQYQEAIPLFKKVIKENPKKADEANYMLGMCQLKQNNYSSAVESFSEALKMREDNYIQALQGRAEAHMASKNYDQAATDLQKIIASSPGDIDLVYKLGLAEYYRDNYNASIEQLKKVVDARPQDADAHYFTGWVYYKLKQYDQTIRHFEIYVKLCPNCPEAEKIKEILRSLKG